jgi:hypothetical protein
MHKDRSGASVVQSEIDCKSWQRRLPTVEEARPARCPCCGAASCAVGAPLQLHGHGTRERQLRGPGDPDQPATTVGITARRYRCIPCGAVLVVVPREVLPGRLYSAAAVALALALWGLVGAAAAEVRRRVCPATILGDAAAASWATLRRWAQAVSRGVLFPSVPKPGAGAPLRSIAASAAAAIAALGDPSTRGLSIERRAFLGAAHAA